MRVADLLRTSDLFEQLSADELDQLGRRFRERPIRHGEIVSRQGEPAQEMFIVVEGSIQLTSTWPDGRVRSVRQLADGAAFGEIALFSGEAHSATACALTAGRVFVLDRDEFDALVAQRTQIMRKVLTAVSRRAAGVNQLIAAEHPSNTLVGNSGRVYAVFSPRGGAGKTTVAVNLAMGLASLLPERVAILDLDLVFDDTALLLNLNQAPALAGMSEEDLEHLDLHTLSRHVVEHDSGLRVVIGAARPEDGERLSEVHVRGVLAAMRRQFLTTVVDCGSTLDKQTLAAVAAADTVIVVCTPELTTLRDLRDCRRIFGQGLRLDKTRLMYVLNHPSPAVGLSRVKFEAALEQPLAVDIPYAGEPAARAALATGTFARSNAQSPFIRALDQLVVQLQPPETGHSDDRTGSGVRGANRFLGVLRGSSVMSGLLANHGG